MINPSFVTNSLSNKLISLSGAQSETTKAMLDFFTGCAKLFGLSGYLEATNRVQENVIGFIESAGFQLLDKWGDLKEPEAGENSVFSQIYPINDENGKDSYFFLRVKQISANAQDASAARYVVEMHRLKSDFDQRSLRDLPEIEFDLINTWEKDDFKNKMWGLKFAAPIIPSTCSAPVQELIIFFGADFASLTMPFEKIDASNKGIVYSTMTKNLSSRYRLYVQNEGVYIEKKEPEEPFGWKFASYKAISGLTFEMIGEEIPATEIKAVGNCPKPLHDLLDIFRGEESQKEISGIELIESSSEEVKYVRPYKGLGKGESSHFYKLTLKDPVTVVNKMPVKEGIQGTVIDGLTFGMVESAAKLKAEMDSTEIKKLMSILNSGDGGLDLSNLRMVAGKTDKIKYVSFVDGKKQKSYQLTEQESGIQVLLKWKDGAPVVGEEAQTIEGLNLEMVAKVIPELDKKSLGVKEFVW